MSIYMLPIDFLDPHLLIFFLPGPWWVVLSHSPLATPFPTSSRWPYVPSKALPNMGIFSHHSLLGPPFNRDIIQSLSTWAYTHMLSQLIHGPSLGFFPLFEYISQCSLEKQNQKGIYEEIYYKEFDHVIMEVDNSNIRRTNVSFWIWRLEVAKEIGREDVPVWRSSGRKNWCLGLETSRQENSLIQGRVSVLFYSKPSTNWIRPTYIMSGNLPYLVYQFKC